MLAPHIRRKVDRLWDRFWSAGLTNSLVAVEQITYLLFLKRLENLDEQRNPSTGTRTPKTSIYAKRLGDDFDPKTCRWSWIRDNAREDPKHLSEVVFPWLRTLDRRLTAPGEGGEQLRGRMADAYFQLDLNKGQVLRDAILLIDELFAEADGSGAQDLMGDTFEYLLSEVATAGKNGQFRTPRHIIRFMVELLAPQPGEPIIDPAAGTGGFLFSAQQFMRRQLSAGPRLEWDGTPHRLDAERASAQASAQLKDGRLLVGVDNDRTIARIGWMNLVLHDIDSPTLVQGDSLASREGKPQLAALLKSETYRHVLANPPYTGTVDATDLERDPLLFPPTGKKGEPTNKSELLFLWLTLDLLQVGGRCAVILPEGVMFGTSEGHRRLRRELLTEHRVEAVISLPGGVFKPYTGVKTSVFVFRKQTPRQHKATTKELASTTPKTDAVWFYEVAEDGFTLDDRRTPKPHADNDLWDALVQFRSWQQNGQAGLADTSQSYHQPRYYRERWRSVQDKLWAIHELSPELPSDPGAAEAAVREHVTPLLLKLACRYIGGRDRAASNEWKDACDALEFFEAGGPAIKLWRELTGTAGEAAKGARASRGRRPVLYTALRPLAKLVAKLDGYDVDLRSLAIDPIKPAATRKCWSVPVRAWTVDHQWRSSDGRLEGSHDERGAVRPEYVADKLPLLEDDDARQALLDPDCIEAREWSLSAGQYKPFDLPAPADGVSIPGLIDELRALELDILGGLDRLKTLVEGVA